MEKIKYYTIAHDKRRFPLLAAAKLAIKLSDDKKKYNNTMIFGYGSNGVRLTFVHVQSADYFVHFKKSYRYV